MIPPVPVHRADTRPVRLPKLRGTVPWHAVCIPLGLVPLVLLAWGVTL